MKSHPTGRRLPSSHRPEAKPTVGSDNMSSRMSIPEIASRSARRPPGGLHDAGAGTHSRHPSRTTVDRHPARLRKLGADLRPARMPTGLQRQPEHKVT